MVELRHRAASGAGLGKSDPQPCREVGPLGIPNPYQAALKIQLIAAKSAAAKCLLRGENRWI
jgi:hypothetical protein